MLIDTHYRPGRSSHWVLFLSIFAVGIVGIAQGYHEVIADRLDHLIASELAYGRISQDARLELIMPLGNIVGAVLAWWPAEQFGRLRTCQAASLAWITSAALWAGSAGSTPRFVAGRIIASLSFGAFQVVAPLYLVEVAPKAHHAGSLSFFLACFFLGRLFGWAVIEGLTGWGQYGNYTKQQYDFSDFRYIRIPAAISIFFAGLSCLLCFLIPESPHWLLHYRGEEAARQALRRMRPDEEQELDSIQNEVQELEGVQERNSWLRPFKSWKILFTRKANAYVLLLASVSQVFVQLSGVDVPSLVARQLDGITLSSPRYVPPRDRDELFSTILNGVTCGLVLLSGIFLVDRSRRVSIWVLGSVQLLCNLYVCIYMEGSFSGVLHYSRDYIEAGKAALGFVFVQAVSFNTGLRILQYLCAIEFFPTSVRTLGFSISTVVRLVMVYAHTQVVNKYEIGRVAIIWTVMTLSSIAWLTLLFPESAGLSLEETQSLFDSDRHQRKER